MTGAQDPGITGNELRKEIALDTSMGGAVTVDSEVLIRRTFETDHLKGCELLFRRYYQPLCSHAVRFVYSRMAAEDIVMEVFSRFWQNRVYQAVNSSYRAYLFTSVRHAAFAYLKNEFGREQSGSTYFDAFTEIENPSNPQQLLQYHELHNKIEEILKGVSPQSQKVFIMSRFEGKKNHVIAKELNLSVKTIEGHITRVISILRRSLRESGFAISFLTSLGSVYIESLKTFFLILIFFQV